MLFRVGRTARAGRSGRSIAFVTQYDIEIYQRVEALIDRKLPAFQCEESTVLLLLERVNEAQRIAARELREQESSSKGSRKGFRDMEELDADTTVKSFQGKTRKKRRR